jgi:hypothetical protein
LDRPFDAWRFANFTTAELAETTTSGSEANPDGDALTNLAERALGGNPKEPDLIIMPQAGLDGNRLSLTYHRVKAALADTSFLVEWADSPGTSWSSAGVSDEVLADDGTTQLVRASVLTGGAAQQFLRLRLVLQ